MSVQPVTSARSGLIQISAAAILWGTGGVVVRLLHDHTGLSPVSIAFYRLAVAVPVLALFSVRRFGTLVRAVRAAPGRLILTGVGLATYQALYFVAVTSVGVGISTMISLGLAPVAITLFETVHGRSLPTARTLMTTAAAVLGLALIGATAAQTGASEPHPLLGVLCAVGSGLVYAGSTVLSQQVSSSVRPLDMVTISALVGALVLAPFAFASGLGFRPTAGPVCEFLYLGPVTVGLAYVLFYLGLRVTQSSTAAVLTLIEPLAAAVLAALILGDRLAPLAILGGVLMLAAVALLYLRPVPQLA